MPDAKPFHLALNSLLKGAILVNLGQTERAERVGLEGAVQWVELAGGASHMQVM